MLSIVVQSSQFSSNQIDPSSVIITAYDLLTCHCSCRLFSNLFDSLRFEIRFSASNSLNFVIVIVRSFRNPRRNLLLGSLFRSCSLGFCVAFMPPSPTEPVTPPSTGRALHPRDRCLYPCHLRCGGFTFLDNNSSLRNARPLCTLFLPLSLYADIDGNRATNRSPIFITFPARAVDISGKLTKDVS